MSLLFCICSEVGFTLEFCTSQDSYAIDQGVRLEVGNKPPEQDTITWDPVRYYTPSVSAPSYDSLVSLNPSNVTVLADALTYTSTFHLKLLEARRAITIKEYLCGNYVQLLANGSENVKLRWMQRFGEQAAHDTAPWAISNIHVKLWNGSCFIEDEISMTDTSIKGNETSQSCSTPQGDSVFHFSAAAGVGLSSTRRSIVIDSINLSPRKCEEGSFSGGKLVLKSSCFVSQVIVALLLMCAFGVIKNLSFFFFLYKKKKT